MLMEILFVIFGTLLALAFILLMALLTSGGAVALAAVIGLIPLAIVALTILWIDRWEPEPRLLLIAAFLWGGGIAVGFASLLNGPVGHALGTVLAPSMDPEFWPAVFGAPLVEEVAKGLGVLLIFLLRRPHFNGPVDGVVYAAVVAAGFAFVENIQYFAFSGQDELPYVFVMRGVLSPFNHLVYTACIGAALGWAARRAGASWVWLFPIGLGAGIVLHGLWNGGAVGLETIGEAVGHFALLAWLPLLGMAILVVWLRRQEVKVIAARLAEYVPSGWLSASEVQMLTSLRARRWARRWAKRAGVGPAMTTFQHAATALAYARQDFYSGRRGIREREREGALLNQITQARAQFTPAQHPAVPVQSVSQTPRF